MKRIIPIIALALTACASTTFVHPTKNAADFDRDLYRCKHRAEQSAAYFGAGGNPIIIHSKTRECLEKLYGWREHEQDHSANR